MPEVFTRLQQQLKESWGNLDKSQRVRIISISAILFVCMTIAIIYFTRPNYEILVSKVGPAEIGEMSKILEEKKIWHELVNDRTAIKVRSSDKNRAQAALVQQGYPKSSSMTFDDAFGKIKLNTTESDRKRLWKEYEEQRLASKLKMLDNVEDASVTLSIPEKSLFVGSENDQEKATASVVVRPKSELTGKQVQGIVMMIAKSVENLNPKDVTVVDTNGNILNDEGDDGLTAGTTRKYELTLAKKKELEDNVKKIFSGQYDSFDNLRVVANVVLDFDKINSKSVKYDYPEKGSEGAVRSSETSEEKVVNGKQGGVPGVQSNPGNNPVYQTGNESSGTYSKKTSTINRELDQTNTETEKALGNVDYDKSSMTVNLIYGINVQKEPSTEVVQNIKQAIGTATGILPAKISVVSFKMTPPKIAVPKLEDKVRDMVNNYGFFAIMLILVIGLLLIAIPGRKRGSGQEAALAGAASGDGAAAFAADEGTGQLLPEIDLEEKSEVKKQIDKFVRQNPEAVAQLLRNWLSDDWD